MAKNLRDALASSVLIFDGGMGVEIYRRRVFTNQSYDVLNLRNRDLISEITRAYFDAGADVLTTNTYGANNFSLSRHGIEDQADAINRAGAEIALEIASSNGDSERSLVAGSVGYPTERILELNAESDVVECFAKQVRSLIDGGVDFIMFESQPSRKTSEIMAKAMDAVDPSFPFVISYGLQRSIFLPPFGLEERASLYAKLFAPFSTQAQPTAWGLNCVLGPSEMLEAVQETIKNLSAPLIVQPNAGAPQPFEGRQLYYDSPEYVATYAMRYVELGAAAVGGCCGVTPDDIAEVAKMVKRFSQSRRSRLVFFNDVQDAAECEESPVATRSRLAEKLVNKEWVQTVETIPPTGYDLTAFIDKAKALSVAGVDAVNLPDGPRASARISSIVAARKVLEEAKIEPVLHVCCRDRNLIGLQADLIGCAALNIKNILFITGDPPKLGNYPNATGVFDCDSIGLCALQRRLNRGIDLAGLSIGRKTDAFFGCGFDPSSINRDRELERLRRKIESGALFAVTQPVFDPDVLLKFMDDYGDLPIPVIAGVWPFVSYRNALFMRKEVPGVVVPDSIMLRMESASTQSKEAQLEMGIQIARESLERLRPYVQGVQVSAPLGRIDVSLRVLE